MKSILKSPHTLAIVYTICGSLNSSLSANIVDDIDQFHQSDIDFITNTFSTYTFSQLQDIADSLVNGTDISVYNNFFDVTAIKVFADSVFNIVKYHNGL